MSNVAKPFSIFSDGTNDYIVKDVVAQNAINPLQGFSMLMPFLADSTYVTTSIISNPEFYAVILDSQDKIIAGIRRDMSYVGLDIPDAIEAIVDVIADIANA